MKKIIILVLSLLFIWWISGFIVAKSDVIINTTPDYLYVRQYSWYNKDSAIYKYKTPKTYPGVVIHQNRHFSGVPGKGGSTKYKTTVKYNNTKHTFSGSSIYHKCTKGKKVQVYERWYPYYKIDLIFN